METNLLGHVRQWLPQAEAIVGLERLSGGANNETWAFEAALPGARRPLILRRQPGQPGQGGPADPDATPTLGPETEAALLRAAGEAGVRVPAVRGVLAPHEGLGRGFVMDRVAGDTRPKRLLHDPAFATARERLLAQCAQALVALHRMPVAAVPPMRHADPRDELEIYERRWRAQGGARPVFELALRWLREHLPAPGVPAPVHGDFRNGNLLVDTDGLAAVLDWELAHRGDPMQDLAWFCVASWRFGELDREAGGFGTRRAWLDAYRAAGGTVDADRVRYWEVFGTFRWGVMCVGMADTWRSGRDRSVERVAVGRRASETELDLLRLLAPRP